MVYAKCFVYESQGSYISIAGQLHLFGEDFYQKGQIENAPNSVER
jgi:hypothetical protein